MVVLADWWLMGGRISHLLRRRLSLYYCRGGGVAVIADCGGVLAVSGGVWT